MKTETMLVVSVAAIGTSTLNVACPESSALMSSPVMSGAVPESPAGSATVKGGPPDARVAAAVCIGDVAAASIDKAAASTTVRAMTNTVEPPALPEIARASTAPDAGLPALLPRVTVLPWLGGDNPRL